MDMTHIDTILASTVDTGDFIELWDEDETEEGCYVIEEVRDVEDDDDYIIFTTDTFPDGMAVMAHAMVRLYGYEDADPDL